VLLILQNKDPLTLNVGKLMLFIKWLHPSNLFFFFNFFNNLIFFVIFYFFTSNEVNEGFYWFFLLSLATKISRHLKCYMISFYDKSTHSKGCRFFLQAIWKIVILKVEIVVKGITLQWYIIIILTYQCYHSFSVARAQW